MQRITQVTSRKHFKHLIITLAATYVGIYSQCVSLAATTQEQAVDIGVTKYAPAASYDGYNLYTNDEDIAFLMDMDGNVVHRWRFSNHSRCEYAYLLKNGDLLGVCVNEALVKVNWHSQILWKFKEPVHHDVHVLEGGKVVVPTTLGTFDYNERRVLFQGLAFLSEQGKLLDEWSTYDRLEELQAVHMPRSLDSPAKVEGAGFVELPIVRKVFLRLCSVEFELLEELCHDVAKREDYYHLNSVQVLPDNASGAKDSRFEKGNYLVCLRNVNLIIILERGTKKVVWHWGEGILDLPHMPSMLPNGNILIFDNGTNRGYSRIVEVNPLTKRIVWQFVANSPAAFFSEWRGSSQRLPNGNTLVCESEKGHAFEVTEDGTIVWDFWNPILDEDGKRRRIYRMIRIPVERVEPLLANYAGSEQKRRRSVTVPE